MKSYILLVTILVIIFCHWSCASTTELSRTNQVSVKQLINKGLANVWAWIQERGKTEDNLIGRCFGAARKLKFVMPLIIFKLGVILTTLIFLTIFSLKSLALLVALFVLNTSGFAAKLAAQKHEEKKSWSHPQNIHFHIYQKKNGGYYIEHPSYGHNTGWSDKNLLGDNSSSDESLYDRLKRLNIYDKT